jgi:hypothetical protein
VVKLLPLGLQVFLEWLLQRRTYARDSTGSRVQSHKEKIHLGRKAGEMLKKTHLPPGLKKQGLTKKRNKIQQAELLKSCELFVVDKNSSFE